MLKKNSFSFKLDFHAILHKYEPLWIIEVLHADRQQDKTLLFYKEEWEGAEKFCSAIQACQCHS